MPHNTPPRATTPRPTTTNDRTRRCPCGAPTDDGSICRTCTQKLGRLLADLPALLNELETTALRMDRLGGSGAATYSTRRIELPPDTVEVLPAHLRTKSGPISLPSTPWAFGWDASHTLADIRHELKRWANQTDRRNRARNTHVTVAGPLCETRTDRPLCDHGSCDVIYRRTLRDGGPLSNLQYCAWLLANLDTLRQLDDAHDIHTAIAWFTREATRTIDRRKPDIYAGRCDADDYLFEPVDVDGQVTLLMIPTKCGTHLYGRDEDPEVTCRGCGTIYVLGDQLRIMREALDDAEATPKVIADSLTSLDLPVNDNTITKWAARARTRRDNGRPPHDGDFYAVGTERCPKHSDMLDQTILDACRRCRPLYRVADVRARVEAAASDARFRAAEKRVNQDRRDKGRVA